MASKRLIGFCRRFSHHHIFEVFAMLPQGFGNGLGRLGLRSGGVGASLAALLLGSTAAIAAPTVAPSARLLRLPKVPLRMIRAMSL